MPMIDDASAVAGGAAVTADHALVVTTPGLDAAGADRAGGDAAAGGVVLLARRDTGENTSAVSVTPLRASDAGRLKVGLNTVLFSDTFNALSQNTNLWAYALSTLSATQPGGYLQIGTVQGTAATHGAFMRTWQYFPMFQEAPLLATFNGGRFVAPMVANEELRMGFGLPAAAGTAPTDGVNFLATTAGLIGELRYNGSVTQTGVLLPFASLALSTLDDFGIIIGSKSATFWINGTYLGEAPFPAANPQGFMQGSLPLYIQKLCTGVVANTNVWRFGGVNVSIGDVNTAKPWSHQLAGAGAAAYAGQNGAAMGLTAGNFGAAALTAAGTGTNTALPTGHSAGLGGIATITAQATNVGAAGDMIVTSYQNPASTVNITGRNLYITGITITCINLGAAVATTDTTLLLGVAYGHTAVTLATTESASFATGTTHAPRKIPIGAAMFISGAEIGRAATPCTERFDTPIVVRPGEFFATTCRFLVGTATPGQSILFAVKVDGYWE